MHRHIRIMGISRRRCRRRHYLSKHQDVQELLRLHDNQHAIAFLMRAPAWWERGQTIVKIGFVEMLYTVNPLKDEPLPSLHGGLPEITEILPSRFTSILQLWYISSSPNPLARTPARPQKKGCKASSLDYFR
jgi:hypothetical protein